MKTKQQVPEAAGLSTFTIRKQRVMNAHCCSPSFLRLHHPGCCQGQALLTVKTGPGKVRWPRQTPEGSSPKWFWVVALVISTDHHKQLPPSCLFLLLIQEEEWKPVSLTRVACMSTVGLLMGTWATWGYLRPWWKTTPLPQQPLTSSGSGGRGTANSSRNTNPQPSHSVAYTKWNKTAREQPPFTEHILHTISQ